MPPGVWQLTLTPIRMHFKLQEIMNYSINRVVMTAIIWKGREVDPYLILYSDTKIDPRCTLILLMGIHSSKTE